ncbi:MAG: hypothetical protein LBT24_04825 [Tannerella sp.]|jgi:uncharacterized membrane protein YqaE (UPF0057 family)|nr:hypothetical protein [Tannerella sp.]
MSEIENNTGQQTTPNQTIIIKQSDVSKSNGIGTAGFVLAIIALFLGWIPALGWILWVLGLLLSFAGMFKKPKGLAIAGLIISLIGLILIIAVFGAIGALLGLNLGGI